MSFLDSGTLIVCGNYEGDLKQICRVLNQWTFDSADDERLKFFIKEGRIEASLYVTPMPHTYPYRTWLEFSDGRRIPDDEARESDFDNDDPKPDTEVIDLERMSKEISRLLTGGILELVVVGHYKLREVYVDRLAIAASGIVERESRHFLLIS